jgi:hypothetical protein
MIVISSCSAVVPNDRQGAVEPASPQQTSTPEQEPSAIQSLDFSNFSYPWVRDFGDPKTRFTLVRGKYSGTKVMMPMDLYSVTYGDVTGDGSDEAIVALSVLVERAPAAPHAIYVYAFENNKPKLLWAFATGDRADGGLRRIYAESGKLVVELYGKGKVLGTDLYANDGTDAEVPYPYNFTRTQYEWSGTEFRPVKVPEILSDPDRYGIPIMPAYLNS